MDYGKFDDDKPIRVIDHHGTQLGIITMADALAKAKELGLDLVQVDPEAKPPVFRIMDYGKFDYDKRKRRKSNLKEIRARPSMGQHDIDFKVKQAIGFLKHNEKVQVTIEFRGREMAHIEEGHKVMENIIAQLEEYGKVESRPSQQARRMLCTIAPLGK